MDRVLAGAAALLGVVTCGLPVWTQGTFGDGDAPAVRRHGLWREEWSGYGGGDAATTGLVVDAGGVVLLLAALVLVTAVASRAPSARLVGVVAAAVLAVACAAALVPALGDGLVEFGPGALTAVVTAVAALGAAALLGRPDRRRAGWAG